MKNRKVICNYGSFMSLAIAPISKSKNNLAVSENAEHTKFDYYNKPEKVRLGDKSEEADHHKLILEVMYKDDVVNITIHTEHFFDFHLMPFWHRVNDEVCQIPLHNLIDFLKNLNDIDLKHKTIKSTPQAQELLGELEDCIVMYSSDKLLKTKNLGIFDV